jgi:hypothetical protein
VTTSADCHFAGTTVAPKLQEIPGEFTKFFPRNLTTVEPVCGPLLGDALDTLSAGAYTNVTPLVE